MSDEETQDQSSFAIVITPTLDKKRKWTGSVTVHMEEDDFGELSDEELMQIRNVCGMMASSLTLMEEDPEFNEYIQEYFLKNFRSFVEDFIEGTLEEPQQPSMTRSKDGKVITLDFSSKTYGEA
jgi:hypothetical protein